LQRLEDISRKSCEKQIFDAVASQEVRPTQIRTASLYQYLS
jgi:hypothetical protein